MSRTIDERVVSMQFDNKHFESNVRTSMSTLDRLKQALNFKGVEKGFDRLNAASKQIDFSKIENTACQAGFRLQDVWMKTATVFEYQIARRITNAATNMAKALTIEPVMTGFKEYETQINAVQTILANTSHNGTTIDQVNAALEQLNKYADMTIYNFTEMTRNIGTFTAAGIDLDTSVSAIQGIANLAAVSGSTSQQASTAMYQLSQALAAGTVKLMDWNSVVNAGMGGKVFQDALKRTAEVMGTNVDAIIEKTGSFRESLREGWITSEVLTKTLEQFTMAAEKGTEQWDKYKKSLMEEGYTEAQAEEILNMANTATDAATKVKTFTQLWDVLKESAQSGWAQTWKLIVGDFEEAKNLLSPLADFLTGIINKMSDFRNKIVEGAMKSPFATLTKQINSMKENLSPVIDTVNTVADTLNNLDEVVNKVIGGEFGNGQARWDKLTEAGYNWAQVQNKVNEKLGSSVRHAEELGKAQDKLNESGNKLNEQRANTLDQLIKLSDAELKDLDLKEIEIQALRELEKQSEKTGIPVKDLIENMDLLSGRSLLFNSFKNIGMSLVEVFKSMKEAWEDVFPPTSIEEKARKIYDLLAAFHKFTTSLRLTDKETGEWTETGEKLIRTFKGVFAVLDLVTTILGGGFKIAFKVISKILSYFDMDILDLTANIGDALVKFNEWFDSLFDVSKILDFIIPLLVSAGEAIKGWYEAFMDLPIVDKFIQKMESLGNIIDSIDFTSWSSIKSGFATVLNEISESIKNLTGIDLKAIGKNIFDGMMLIKDAFLDIPIIDKFIQKMQSLCDILKSIDFTSWTSIKDGFKAILDSILDSIENLTGIDLREIGSNIIDGLVNGVNGRATEVVNNIIEIGKQLVEGIKTLLGIHSPSTVFFEIGSNIIDGLINGLKAGATAVINFVKGIFSGITEFFTNLDWGKIFAVGATASILFTIKKLVDVFTDLTAPLRGVGDVLSGVGEVLEESAKPIAKVIKNSAKVVKSFSKVLNSFSMSLKAKALKDIAIAIAIIAGSIALLTMLDTGKMLAAAGALTVLVGMLALVISKLGKMDPGKADIQIAKMVGLLWSIAGVMLILGIVTKMIGKMEWEDLGKAGAALVVFGGIVTGLIAASKLMTGSKNIDKIGGMILKIGAAMLLMAVVAKIIAGMTWEEMGKAGAALVAFGGIVTGLIAASQLMSGSRSKNLDKIGGMILKIAGAFLLMTMVAKIIAGMTWEDLGKAGAALIVFGGIVVGLTAMSKLMAKGANVDKIGGTILKIAGAFLLMTIVAKIIAGMTWEEMGKAGAGLVAFGGIVTGLIAATKLAGKDIDKVGGTILAIGAAMLLLSFAAKKIADMEWGEMGKAGVGLVGLGVIIAGLIYATRLAGDKELKKVASTLLVMSISIGILAAVATLLGMLPLENLAKGIIAVGMLSAMMALMIASTKNAQNCMQNLVVMTVAIGIMAAAVAGLSFIDTKSLAGATIAMSTLMGMFALMTKAAGSIKGSVIGSLIVMTVAVGLMAGMIALLAQIPVEASLGSALSLSVLLLAVSASMVILNKLGGQAWTALSGVILLTAMAVPLLAFVGILALMQNIQNATANILALVTMTTALTLLLIPLSVIGYLAGGAALIGVIALTAMAVPLLAFVGILALMQNIQNATANANLLITLMTTMTQILVVLAIIGPLALIGVAAMAGLTGLIIAIGALAIGVGALMEKFPALQSFLDTGIPVLEQLAHAIGSVIGNLISGFMGGVAEGLSEIGLCLSQFIINLMPFITGVKLVDSTVLEGAGILAASILTLTAADLIAGISSFIQGGSSFGQLGTDLSNFITNAQPFIEGIKTIDASSIEAAKSLAGMILVLTAADLLNGITSFITGGTDFASFGEQLIPFGEAICAFSNTIVQNGGIDESAVTAAANAGKIMAEMQSSLYGTGGIIQWFCGEKDMTTFGAQLRAFGSAICDFSNTIVNNGGIDESAVQAAANAGSIMAELQSDLVGTGGVVQWFTGEKNFATFGTQLVAFGQALVDFSAIVGAEGALNDTAIEAAAKAGTLMTTLQSSITSTGGVVEWFTGEKNLSTFGTQLKAFGQALVDFSGIVGADGALSSEAVTAAANAGEIMSSLQKSLPEDKWFDGKMSLEDFGKKIKKFGESIADYAEEVAEIDTTVVSSSITSATRLANLARSIVDLDATGIETFKSVKSIGSTIKDYAANFAEVDLTSVSTSITTANNLVSLIQSLVGLDTSGISNFSSAIASLGEINLDAFVNAFSGAASTLTSTGMNLIDSLVKGITSRQSSVTSTAVKIIDATVKAITSKAALFTKAGVMLMTNLAKGISSQKARVKAAILVIISTAISGIHEYYGSFYSAGSYLVDGFAAGISANSYKAAAQAAAMASAAAAAARAELDINSPSKVFRAIGYSVPEGFAMGIDKLSGMATKSAVSMADGAINSVKNTISRIANAINSDIDAQPTIRPVLDLSGVESGAGVINGLFNTGASVGVLANVGTIGTMMNRRIQNGGNSDVVSAIDKLRSDLDSKEFTSYNVNGITYDDGSNITNTVKDLIRYARVERRI